MSECVCVCVRVVKSTDPHVLKLITKSAFGGGSLGVLDRGMVALKRSPESSRPVFKSC